LVKPFYIFAIDRYIQNLVGAEAYGMYFSLLGFSLLFNIISDFGITNYNSRNIAINQSLLKDQLGILIPIKIIISIIYCIITLLFAFFVHYSSEQVQLLIWLIFNQIIVSFILYLRSNISGIQKFNMDSTLSVIDKIILILICSFLLWGGFAKNFEIKHFVLAQTISYVITLLFAFYIVLSNSGRINLKFKYKFFFKTLKESFPYAILMFLMIAYTRVDVVMIERLLPDGKMQAGIYAQSFRLIDAMSMFAFLFATILLPLFAKMLKEKKPIYDILNHAFNMLFIPSTGLVIALFVYANEFMGLLYHQHIIESAMVLKYLVFSYIGICLSYIFGTLITASGKIKLLNKISLGALLFNVLLNAILIPNYGLKGAAICNMTTLLGVGVLQMVLAYRIFKVGFSYKNLAQYAVLVLSICLFSYLLKTASISWYLSLFTIPILSIIIGFALKLIKVENVALKT